MDAAVEAVDAKDYAADRVAQLLDYPEKLEEVERLRSDFSRKQTAVEAQLRTAVQARLQEGRRGLQELRGSFATIEEIGKGFSRVNELSQEVAGALNNYPLIHTLATMRRNYRLLLSEVDKLLDVPHKVKKLSAMLNDPDPDVLYVHEEVHWLEKRREAHLHQVLRHPDKAALMEDHFRDVDFLDQQLRKRLSALFRSALSLAENNQQRLLVAMARVVMRQEAADQREDAKLVAADQEPGHVSGTGAGANGSGGGTPSPSDALAHARSVDPPLPPKHFAELAVEHLQRGIKERFDARFRDVTQRLVQLPSAPASPEDNAAFMRVLRDATHSAMDDLTLALDLVQPCFPPAFPDSRGIFHLFCRESHKQLYQVYTVIASEAVSRDVFSNAEVLTLIGFLPDYAMELERLGVDADVMEPSLMEAFQPLVQRYIEHIRTLMREWRNNIVKIEESSGVDEADGLYYTPAPRNLFEFVQTQLDVAFTTRHGPFVAVVAIECAQVMRDFQRMLMDQIAQKSTDLEFDYVCALVNNNARCADYVIELQQRLHAAFGGFVSDHMDGMDRGFHSVAVAAISLLIRMAFDHMCSMYAEDFFSSTWIKSNSEAAAIQFAVNKELEEFFLACRPRLLPTFFRKLKMQCMETCVVRYLSALVSRKLVLGEDFANCMLKDVEEMTLFFTEHGEGSRRFQTYIKCILAVANVIGCSPEMMSLQFTSLLRLCPARIAVQLCETLLPLRRDWGRDKVASALDGVRESLDNTGSKAKTPDATAAALFTRVADAIPRTLVSKMIGESKMND